MKKVFVSSSVSSLVVMPGRVIRMNFRSNVDGKVTCELPDFHANFDPRVSQLSPISITSHNEQYAMFTALMRMMVLQSDTVAIEALSEALEYRHQLIEHLQESTSHPSDSEKGPSDK